MASYVLLLCFVVATWTMALAAPWSPPSLSCKDVPVISNFNRDRYMGDWIEAYRSFNLYEMRTKCNHAFYAPDGPRVDIEVGQRSRILGKVRFPLIAVPDAREPSRMTAYTQGWSNMQASYMILDTDYDQYALVYLCIWNQFLPTLQNDAVWLLTRKNVTVSEEFADKMRGKLKSLGINRPLIKVDQTGCDKVQYD